MTPKEAQAAFAEFEREVGPDAEVYPSLETKASRPPYCCTVYPSGITCNDLTYRVTGADWPELLAAARAKWDEHKVRHRAQAVRKMALEVIRITHELGACSEAALRGAKFCAADIAAYGEEACATANSMASNGPFSITPSERANAPAGGVEARGRLQ